MMSKKVKVPFHTVKYWENSRRGIVECAGIYLSPTQLEMPWTKVSGSFASTADMAEFLLGNKMATTDTVFKKVGGPTE
jgi:hypothetical protein